MNSKTGQKWNIFCKSSRVTSCMRTVNCIIFQWNIRLFLIVNKVQLRALNGHRIIRFITLVPISSTVVSLRIVFQAHSYKLP